MNLANGLSKASMTIVMTSLLIPITGIQKNNKPGGGVYDSVLHVWQNEESK